MSSIFGGSKSKSSSSNRAYDQLSSAFSPMFGQATGAANQIQALLGGDSSGFNAYKDATGFNAMTEQGSRGITNNAAAKGLLRSGASGKALVNYGNTMQNQYAGNYIQQLLGLGGMGLQAGGLVGGAGQTSTSTSKSKPGIGGFLGQVGAGIATSDPRSKKNVNEIGTYGDVNLYTFRYKTDENNSPLHVGVMANEVADKYPEALGPVTDTGYMTVNYDKLKELVEG